jgi:hypothetical protein
MSEQNMARAFVVLWWTLGVLLIAFSTGAVWQTFTASGGIDAHSAILESTEAVAGFLFINPKTMRAGGGCLLTVFALALVLHGMKGEFEGRLLIYAIAVSFVLLHGPREIAGRSP